MTVTCKLCGSEVGDLANVCPHCAAGLRRDLVAIPGLDRELDVTAYGQARIVSGNAGGGRSDHEPLPVNFDADARGRKLKSLLASWCALITEQRGVPAPIDGLPTMSRWMLGHVEWLRHHPSGPDCVVEIRDGVRDVRVSIDRPADRDFAGRCDTCGTLLYAHQNAEQTACRICLGPEGERLFYAVTERRDALLASMADLELPAADIARALTSVGRPVKPAHLYTWVHRKKLRPTGADARGRTLFRMGDVMALLVPVKQAV